MQHHRRKKLLSALNEMYLNNFRRAATWTESNTLHQQMGIVSTNLHDQIAREDELKAAQLRLQQLSLF